MKQPKLSNDKKKKLVVKLSWWILEQKLFYYNPQFGKCVHDDEYDKKEILYNECCEDLGLEPTASNNVGFPWDSASGRLVASKFCKNDSRPKVNFNVDKNCEISIAFENELEEALEKMGK